ncbi:MAG: hypothetical protein L6N96_03345 [Candidatus Methylarchaceae archaeon HK02M2]|nr:hypothetical protein [Candidatus Methylarchaceae archaeon HK02M2]
MRKESHLPLFLRAISPLFSFAIRYPHKINFGNAIKAYRNFKVENGLTLINVNSLDFMSKFIAKYPQQVTAYVGYCQKSLDCPKDKAGIRSKECDKCSKKDEPYPCQIGILKERFDKLGSKLKIISMTEDFIEKEFLYSFFKNDTKNGAFIFVSCPVMRKLLLPLALPFYRPNRPTIIFDLKYNVCDLKKILCVQSRMHDKQTFPSNETFYALLKMLDKAREYQNS